MATTFTATTPYGTFTRRSTRIYTHCIARQDGWHQFSQSLKAAQKEFAYQTSMGVKTGREHPPVLVEVARG